MDWWYGKPKESKEKELIDYLEHELEVFGENETMEILIDTDDVRRILQALKAQLSKKYLGPYKTGDS